MRRQLLIIGGVRLRNGNGRGSRWRRWRGVHIIHGNHWRRLGVLCGDLRFRLCCGFRRRRHIIGRRGLTRARFARGRGRTRSERSGRVPRKSWRRRRASVSRSHHRKRSRYELRRDDKMHRRSLLRRHGSPIGCCHRRASRRCRVDKERSAARRRWVGEHGVHRGRRERRLGVHPISLASTCFGWPAERLLLVDLGPLSVAHATALDFVRTCSCVFQLVFEFLPRVLKLIAVVILQLPDGNGLWKRYQLMSNPKRQTQRHLPLSICKNVNTVSVIIRRGTS